MPAFGEQMGGPTSRQPSPEPQPTPELVTLARDDIYGQAIIFNKGTDQQSELCIKKAPFAEGSNGVKAYEATFFKSLVLDVDDGKESFRAILSQYNQVSYCIVKVAPEGFDLGELKKEADYIVQLGRSPSKLPKNLFQLHTGETWVVSRKSSPTPAEVKTLAKVIETGEVALTFQKRCDILRQVAGELAFFSHEGVVHGDLHMGNVTLHPFENKWHAAVIDFGESVDVDQKKNKTIEPRYWLPAKMLAKKMADTKEEVECTEQVDLFGFAVLVLQLLFKPNVLQKVFVARCEKVNRQMGIHPDRPLDLSRLEETDFLDETPEAFRAGILNTVLLLLNEERPCLEDGYNANYFAKFFKSLACETQATSEQAADAAVQPVSEPIDYPSDSAPAPGESQPSRALPAPVSTSQKSSCWGSLAKNLTSLSAVFGGSQTFFSPDHMVDHVVKRSSNAGAPAPGSNSSE